MFQRSRARNPAGWVAVLAGLWLYAAPFVLHYPLGYPNVPPMLNDLVFATLLVATGFLMAREGDRAPRLRFVLGCLGAWLVVAPLVFGYQDAGDPVRLAQVNDLVVGLVVLAATLLAGLLSGPPVPAATRADQLR